MLTVRCVVVALIVLPSFALAEEVFRTGAFEVSRTLPEIMGEQAARNAAHVIGTDEPISWDVFVPEDYDPAEPPGLFVYMSPTYSGAIPRPWRQVLARKNLIWVGANDAGNSVNVQRRALFALIAPNLIRQDYDIDAQRIYISGLSGGGKMASMMSTEYAHIFKGAVFNCGVEFWDRHPPRRFEAVKQNRYVFVTGEHDQALRPTKRVYGRYQKAGVPNIKLMVIAGMGHENPDADHLAEALEFLDGAES
jgi:hypothetical protein